MKTYPTKTLRQAFSKRLNGQSDYITLIRSDIPEELAYNVFKIFGFADRAS
jgi:hypothetical protein